MRLVILSVLDSGMTNQLEAVSTFLLGETTPNISCFANATESSIHTRDVDQQGGIERGSVRHSVRLAGRRPVPVHETEDHSGAMPFRVHGNVVQRPQQARFNGPVVVLVR